MRFLLILFCFSLTPLTVQSQEISGNFAGGSIKVGTDSATCDSNRKGAIRYNDTADVIEYCNGSVWANLLASSLATSDPAPNSFSFTDVTTQPFGTLIFSNTITVTGFDGPVIAEVSGSGSPQLSINGGSWVSATTIMPGDTLKVRQISSSAGNNETLAVVNVGTGSDSWSVTTGGALRIFLTAGTYSGDKGGLSGADAICATEAGLQGYVGTWKALLSDSTTNAKDRLTITYPVVRATDPTIVVSAANLWTGILQNSVTVASGGYVMTGTSAMGTKGSDSCTNWSSSSAALPAPARGASDSKTSSWLLAHYIGCDYPTVMYCIEQP